MRASPATWSTLLTPAGPGAIGVIRVRGPNAPMMLEKAFLPKNPRLMTSWRSGRLQFGRIVDGDETLDEVLVSRLLEFDEPAFDISVHGGIRVAERVLQLFEKLGVPFRESMAPHDVFPSQAGCGPSMIEVEALTAIARAKTRRAVRFLAWQRQFLPAYLETLAERCSAHPGDAAVALRTLRDRAPAARALVNGAIVAVVGPPNSGKSTLFNRLLGRDAAMVSDRPGTTRDWVAESIDLRGVPLTLVDTAGQHQTTDALEGLAIRRGRQLSARADVLLLVLDGTKPLGDLESKWMYAGEKHARTLLLVNKADLLGTKAGSGLRCARIQPWAVSEAPEYRTDRGDVGRSGTAEPDLRSQILPTLRISAQIGTGIDSLWDGIRVALGFADWMDENPSLFSQRQEAVCSDILAGLADDPAGAAVAIRTSLWGLGVDTSCQPVLE